MSIKSKTSRPPALEIEYIDPAQLAPDERNSRIHTPGQLVRLQAAIDEFGFTAPVMIDETGHVIAGHARLIVAEKLGITSVPCVRLSHLSSAQKRALAIADNKIAELAEWDFDALRHEFASLGDLEFPIELTGFDTTEIDIIMDFAVPGSESSSDPADSIQTPDDSTPSTTLLGDCWLLGGHRLVCGDALQHAAYQLLLGKRRAAMVITDPPRNIPIDGNASGVGKLRHRKFPLTPGEMPPLEFIGVLRCSMEHMAQYSAAGSLHFLFTDWRHFSEIMTAGAQAFAELKELCVWSKRSGPMGSLYRSQHELVFVFENGRAPHQNNIQLGKNGRHRSNVWEYAGVNGFDPHRDKDHVAPPTVKPVAMIADAIRDCSKRGDIILDPFARSGTILIAAERTGRKAAAIELDPRHVDTAVKRWQQSTGQPATLLASGETYDQTAERRASLPKSASELLVFGKSSND